MVADIFQNFANTTNTITNNSGRPFSFTSIGLADVYNQSTGGNIQFTFNGAGARPFVVAPICAAGRPGVADQARPPADLARRLARARVQQPLSGSGLFY